MFCEKIYIVSTQSLEGGCPAIYYSDNGGGEFQHTATRKWLLEKLGFNQYISDVSTHSHAKATAGAFDVDGCASSVSTHSRAKAAAASTLALTMKEKVSTHSRPKSAAFR